MSPTPSLSDLIEHARRAVHRDITVAVAGAALLVIPLVLAVSWLLAGGSGWAAPSPGPLAVEVAAVSAILAVVVLARRNWLRGTAERDMAAMAEAKVGLPSGSVLGVLELGREVPPGMSVALFRKEAVVVGSRFVGQRVHEVTGVVGRRARRRRVLVLGALAVMTVFTGILGFASPDRVQSGWTPLLHPLAHLSSPPLPPLEILPGDTEVLRGSDLSVQIRAPGRFAVTLAWRADGDVLRRETVAVDSDSARAIVKSVDARTEYWVEAPDGAVSARYVITPRDPLLITDLTVFVRYPEYVGRPADRYSTEVPPLELPEGTILMIDGRATRTLSAATLAGGSGDAARFATDGDRFTGSWSPRSSGVYEWRVRSSDGSSLVTAPSPLEITVLPDGPPSVEMTYPGRDTVIDDTRIHPFAADARDDYGIAAATLVLWRVTAGGQTEPPSELMIPLESSDRVLVRGIIDLSDRELLPGDTIKYFVRVLDNSPRRQAGVSSTFALYLPGAGERRDRLTEEAREAVKKVEDLAQATQQLNDATRTLERRTEANRSRQNQNDPAARTGDSRNPSNPSGSLGFREAEQARQILEEQQRVMQQLEELREKMQSMQQQMENSGLRDAETQKKLQELREMYDQLLNPELRKQMEALQEALSKLDPAQLEKALEQLAEQQANMKEKLEESLEDLKRAEAEQRANALAQEARELATQQQALAQAMRDRAPTPQDADMQRRLGERASEINKGVEQLGKDLEQQKASDAAQEAGKASNELRQAQQQMQRAADQAASRQGEQAAQSGEEAARRLEEAANRLQETRNAMADEATKAMREALQQATNEALSLAERQQALKDRMEQMQQQSAQEQQGQQQAGQQQAGQRTGQQGQQQGQQGQQGQQQGQRGQQQQGQQQQGQQGQQGQAGQQGGQQGQQGQQNAAEMQRLREEQAALQQGLEQLGRNLSQASEKSGSMSRDVGSSLGRANISMQQTAQGLEKAQQGQQMPTQQAGQSVEALNRLALSLLNQQQGNQQQAGGTEQTLQQLSDIAQQQGQLNGRSNALMPMNLPSQTREQQVQKLAREQRDIASQLDGVNQRGNREDILGRVNELAAEAERLARELEGGRLPADVLARQERLFHRLLDAGRSLERDEQSNERVAERPGAFTPAIAPALNAALIEPQVRYRVPTPDELKELPPAMRKWILDYYDRINKTATPEKKRE